jgi:cell division protein FtsB
MSRYGVFSRDTRLKTAAIKVLDLAEILLREQDERIGALEAENEALRAEIERLQALPDLTALIP